MEIFGLPHTYPLVLLAKRHHLHAVEPSEDYFFAIADQAQQIQLSYTRIVPQDIWTLTQEKASPDFCVGQENVLLPRITEGDYVTLTGRGYQYNGNRCALHKRSSCQVSSMIKVAGSKTIAVSSFDDLGPAKEKHGAPYIMTQWSILHHRVKLARRLDELNAPLIIVESQKKLIDESLAALKDIPGLSSIRNLGAPVFVDLDACQSLITSALPHAATAKLERPEDISWAAVTERLGVKAVYDGDRLEEVQLSVMTCTEPSARAKRGFAFLKRELGFIPSLARANTHGEKRVVSIDPAKVDSKTKRSGFVWYDAPSFSTLHLKHYVQALLPLLLAAKPYFEEFAASGLDEAFLVPA